MADSTKANNISDKIRQIQGKITTTNTLNGFINNKFVTSLITNKNSDNQNVLKMLSDILSSLVGSEKQFKEILIDLITNNLNPIESKIKTNIKRYSMQMISCGVDGKLNLPLGVIDQLTTTSIPQEQYPYIDQYDFYGLFTKDIDDPIQNLQFDRNLNTFIKTNINSQKASFIWKDTNSVDVVQFTYYEQQERIKVGPPPSQDWGPNGIGVKSFVDLYIDSINLFPTESILKDLLDQVFKMKSGGSTDVNVNLEFLSGLILPKCNCKTNGDDDRSKSTFDLGYSDFVPKNRLQRDTESVMTDIKFGPVDAPIPYAITPQQPNLNETYLNTVTVLTKDDFIRGNRLDRENAIKKAIDNVTKDKNNQTSAANASLNAKFSFKPNLESDTNLKMLLMLPVVLVTPLFSPKMSIYFSIIYKRYYIAKNGAEPAQDLWKDQDEYYLFVSKIVELILMDILEYLLAKLFAYIKKEVIKLVKKLIIKILGDKVMGYVAQIQSLIDLYNTIKGKIPPKLPNIPEINFNSCKSILDNIQQLFEIPNIPPGAILPPGMSMMGMAKTGLSSTAITQTAVEKMNKYGLNTNAMPDGTPNPNVIIAHAVSSALVEGIQKSARIQVSTVGVGYSEGGGTIT